MKICPFCEAENDDNALTCIQCEYDFSNKQPEEVVDVQNEAENCSESSSAQPQNVIDCVPIVSEDNDVIYYTPEKDKKPILIAGITFALILIIAAFIIIPKIADKRSSTDLKSGQPASDNKIAEVSEQKTTTQEATTEAVTTAVTESTTVTTSQTTVTTTVTTTTTPAATAPPVDYKAAYTKILEDYKQSIYYDSDDEYGIMDVTGDGIPELFIFYNSVEYRLAETYVYKDSAYQLIDMVGIFLQANAQFNPENNLLQYVGYGGGRGRYIIKLTSDGVATQVDETFLSPGNGNDTYYRNDISISQSEYEEAERYYDSLGWQPITKYSFSNINVNAKYEPYKTYNKYSIPNDFFEFTSTLFAKVNVQSGGLNLRAAPSTDSFVITLLPNDTDLWVMASNGSWSLVRYNIYDNGRDMSFFGYVSNEFLAYN